MSAVNQLHTAKGLRLLQVPVYVLHAVGQCSNLGSLDLLHQHSVTLEGLQALSSLTGLQVSIAHHFVRSMGLSHEHCAPVLTPSLCLSLLKAPTQAGKFAWCLCHV